jgi:hypothetical protein
LPFLQLLEKHIYRTNISDVFFSLCGSVFPKIGKLDSGGNIKGFDALVNNAIRQRAEGRGQRNSAIRK